VCVCVCVCVWFRSGLSVLGLWRFECQVSLITGIGEKVSRSRLTTPVGWGVCALGFGRVCVCLSAYGNVCMCVSYSYLSVNMRVCVCVCVMASARPWAEIDSPAKGEEMRRGKKKKNGTRSRGVARAGIKMESGRRRKRIEGGGRGEKRVETGCER